MAAGPVGSSASHPAAQPHDVASLSRTHAGANVEDSPRLLKHGGRLTTTSGGRSRLYVEAVVNPNGKVYLYVSEANGTPIDPREIGGTVTCQLGPVKTTTDVAVNDANGAAEGQCVALSRAEMVITYSLRIRDASIVEALRASSLNTAGPVRDTVGRDAATPER